LGFLWALLRDLKPHPSQKILAANRHIFSVDALVFQRAKNGKPIFTDFYRYRRFFRPASHAWQTGLREFHKLTRMTGVFSTTDGRGWTRIVKEARPAGKPHFKKVLRELRKLTRMMGVLLPLIPRMRDG